VVAVVRVLSTQRALTAALVSLSSRFRPLPLAVSVHLMAHPQSQQRARQQRHQPPHLTEQPQQAALVHRLQRLTVQARGQARPARQARSWGLYQRARVLLMELQPQRLSALQLRPLMARQMARQQQAALVGLHSQA